MQNFSFSAFENNVCNVAACFFQEPNGHHRHHSADHSNTIFAADIYVHLFLFKIFCLPFKPLGPRDAIC